MDRKTFLRSLVISGGTIASAGLLSACKTATDANDVVAFDDDEATVIAGAEFEAMGIKTYEVAAASGLLTDQPVIDTAVAYMQDHIGHLAALNGLLQSFGRSPIDPTDADPATGVGSVTNQTDVIMLALDVEFKAASFYFSGIVNVLKSTEARRVFSNILPVETAHFVTYKNVLGFAPSIDGSLFEEMSSGLT